MEFRHYGIVIKRFWRQSRLLQIGALVLFWALGEGLASIAHLPLPGGILGLFVVLTLLISGHMHALQLRRGASLLLTEMLLFFVPAVLTVLDHHEFFGLMGLKVLGAVLGGTLIVMGGTAVTVDLCFRAVRHDR